MPQYGKFLTIQGNRKIMFTAKANVAIPHRKAGRNLAPMNKVLGLA